MLCMLCNIKPFMVIPDKRMHIILLCQQTEKHDIQVHGYGIWFMASAKK